jgi:hypothetical protein
LGFCSPLTEHGIPAQQKALDVRRKPKLTFLKFAILIHILDWDFNETEYIIDNGISLIHIRDHPIEKLYHSLFKEKGIDDEEPFMFNTALVLYDETNEDHSFYPSASPQSLSSIFLNLLTILNGASIGICRVIGSKDNFDTSWGTYELYDALTENVYELTEVRIELNKQNLELVHRIWNNLKIVWASGHSRIDNALTFYYLSWNTHTFEQTAISLSIVIETLFSPDSNTELSHQIAFNLAKFMGETKADRNEKYGLIKKYYSIRSKLVHGDSIKNAELDSIPIFFNLISNVFLKILIDKELIVLFNDNAMRKVYLKDKLFD